MLLPGLNLALVTTVFVVGAMILAVVQFLLSMAFLGYGRHCMPVALVITSRSAAMFSVQNNLTLVAVSLIIIISIEETIASNQVAPGEAAWGLGQTLALFVACFPLLDLARWIAKGPFPRPEIYSTSHNPVSSRIVQENSEDVLPRVR